MITPDMIAHERISHFIGENLVVKNVVQTKEQKTVRTEKARIIGIYRNFCLVTNGYYCYSVKWIDFLQEEETQEGIWAHS